MRKTPYLPRCSWNMLQLRGLTLLISSRRNYVLCGDSVKARGSQRIFQSDTTQLLPCLGGLFPPSDLWYSSRSPSHRPSTPRLRELRGVFSWSPLHWVLCRWLAGVYQRITTPLFLMVINCQFIVFLSSLIVTGPLYHNWLRKSSVYTDYLFFFFCFSLVIFGSTPYYNTLSWNVKRGPRGGACGVGCLDLTIDLSHSNIFPHFESPTDI